MPKAALGKSHGQTLAWCVLSPSRAWGGFGRVRLPGPEPSTCARPAFRRALPGRGTL